MSLIRKHVAVLQAWACLALVLISRRRTLLISECNRRFYVSEQVGTLFLPEMFGADERGTPIVLGRL